MANATSRFDQSAGDLPGWVIACAGLAALANAMGIGRFAFTPILPMMQDDFALPVSAASWLATANYVGYFLGALSAIRMRMQPIVLIRAGLLAIGVSTLAMGLVHQYALWIVLRAVAGLASAWVLIFASALTLERLASLGRSGLSGVFYSGVGTGIAVAGLACLLVSHFHADSNGAWLALGVLSLALTAAIWPLVRASPARAEGHAPVAPAAGAGAGERWRLALCYGAFGFGYIVPATFLPAMAKDVIADPRLFGWAWPLFGAAAIVSTLVAAPLSRVLSHRAIWIAGHLTMAVGVVIPLVLAGLPGILLAALLVGGTVMVITAAGLQEARRVGGPQARVLMAALTSAFALGQILGPVFVSLFAANAAGFSGVLIVAAVTLVASAIGLIDFGNTRKDR